MLQAFCHLSVDGFKDTQVMLQRGQFCGMVQPGQALLI